MIGDSCCIFIPNNTAPNGSVTRALEGLRALSKEIHDNSGVKGWLSDLLNTTFGQWKGFFLLAFTAVFVVLAVFVLCGCCCIPCIRSLCGCVVMSPVKKHSNCATTFQMALLTEQSASLLAKADLEDDTGL